MNVNWSALVLMLRRYHAPYKRIAELVGCDQRALANLSRGMVVEPKFKQGAKLLALAHQYLPAEIFHQVTR